MSGKRRSRGRGGKGFSMRTRRLDVEALDNRLMMSATPWSVADAAQTETIDHTPPDVEAPGSDLTVALAETVILETNVAFPGGGAYPNPEDDDGDWGPIGPWVHEALDRLTKVVAEQIHELPGLPGGGSGYPAPDDDGDWGPLGPVVHDALSSLVGTLTERLHDELPAVLMRGGGGGSQPVDDDDTEWPPHIGPVIRTADELYDAAAQHVLRQLLNEEAGPDPTPWTADRVHEHIQETLIVWVCEPDPDPWIDWTAVIQDVIGGSGGDVGYPADDDDTDWGPIGPVVHDTVLEAGDTNGDLRFDQTDIVEVLQAGKYMTGERAGWRQGDFNHDGFFNQLDIVAALSTDNYMEGSYAERTSSVDLVLEQPDR